MASDISKALKRYVPVLLQAQRDNMNEADTVQRLIKVFEDVLGYNSLTEISREAQMKNKYVDVSLKIDGVVRLLVERGADVNATDKTGRNNALIEAIKGRHYAIAEYLLATGKLNFLNKDIRLNALIWAGSSHDHPFIEKLETAIRKFFDGN